MLLLPGVGSALETSLQTIRLQVEDRGRGFFSQLPDPNGWTPQALQGSGIVFLGRFRVVHDSVETVQSVRLPGCPIPRTWKPGMDIARQALDRDSTGFFLTKDEIPLYAVCRIRPDSTVAVAAYPVDASVLRAREEIVRALNVYNTLTLLKESIIRKHLIWGIASLLVMALSMAAVSMAKRISGGISGPIQDLVRGMHRIAAGDFDLGVQTRARDEIRFLVDSFNTMVQDLKTTRQRLFEAEKLAAWQEAARRISHEIRNSLTPVFLSFRRIKNACQDMAVPAPIGEPLHTIEEQLVSLEKMAGEFSDFARMPRPVKKDISLNEAVSSVTRLFEENPENVTVKTELSEESLTVHADREQLKRGLHNIVKNAVEASPKNGTVVVRTRSESGPDRSVVVDIEDAGDGIADDDLKKIFQPYYTTKGKGTGLGLAIVQKIVEDHDGRLDVQSEKGKGTRFTVRLRSPS
jgi:nitrogen fixation/metabolism regulation signal transduction histidine kinase